MHKKFLKRTYWDSNQLGILKALSISSQEISEHEMDLRWNKILNNMLLRKVEDILSDDNKDFVFDPKGVTINTLDNYEISLEEEEYEDNEDSYINDDDNIGNIDEVLNEINTDVNSNTVSLKHSLFLDVFK